ncbi:hypothetical protein ABIB25_000392 [Nakamurella sp. UYEF19]|uniref:hypothetical protein n=1 Tax=Nakamurella sp. UYEF19 TaxID=1756392 RepID=UPI003393FD40
MTGPSALDAAVEDLYSHPMAEFTTRRKALAAAARKVGDRDGAGRIAALRKPTLAADTLNQLVRSAPDEVGELLRLGAELREAEQALDAHQLRELTGRRRSLVRDLADLAFDVTGQPTPSASIRDEVAGTLNAALADEQVAELLMSGVLVTQAHWDGFGSTTLPELAAVLSLDTLRQARRARAESPPASPKTSAPQPAAGARTSSAVTVRTSAPPGSKRAGTDRATAEHAAAEQAATDQATAQQAAAQRAAADQAAAQQAAADRTAAQQAAADRTAAQQAVADRAAADRARRVAAAEQEAADAQAGSRAADEAVQAIEGRIKELGRQLAAEREHLAEQQKMARAAQIRRRAAQLALTRAGGNRT